MAGEWNVAAAIAEAIRERDTSVPKVAEAAGIPVSTMYRIVRGTTKRVTQDQIERIADALDVPQSRLTGRRGTAEDSPQYMPVIAIPVIDQEVSASLRGGVVVEHVYLPAGEVPEGHRRNTIALRVRGDCLSPAVVDGDTVIVDTEMAPESGNPVVATIDGHLHVKRLKVLRSGRWMLTSNEGELEVEPFQIDGVVVGLYRAMGPRLRR